MSLFPRPKTVKIGLRCLACGRSFTLHADRLFCDLGTLERKQKGEAVPFSEFFVPAKVVCPHCGAEDRYDLSKWQYLRVFLSMLWMRLIPPGPGSWFQAIYMGKKDGCVMHPFELRDWYAERVARNPKKMKWRLGYANTLRTMGRKDEAETQYHAVLALVPRQTEALLNLAALQVERGAKDEALQLLYLLAATRPKNDRQREQVGLAQDVLNGSLSLDDLEIGNPARFLDV